jgi:uncharacterized protein involved in outer membrane biogenesis
MALKRNLFRLIIGVFVLLAAAGTALFTIDLGFLRATVEKRVELATGRDFSLGESFSVRLGRDLLIRGDSLQMANVPWAGDQPLLEVAQFEAVLDPYSLFGGPVLVRSLEVSGVKTRLAQNDKEESNWQFTGPDPAADDAGALAVLVETLSLADAQFTFDSPRLDGPLQGSIESLTQSLNADSVLHLELAGELNGSAVQVQTDVGPYERLLDGNDIRLQGSGSFGKISVTGSALLDDAWAPLRPEMELSINGPELKELTDMLGIQGLGTGALSFSAASRALDSELEVEIKGVFGEFNVDVVGRVPSLQDTAGASLQAQLQGPNFGRLARLAGESGWPEAPFKIDTRLSRPEQALNIERFTLLLAGAEIGLAGEVPQFPAMDGANLDMQINGKSLVPFAAVLGLESPPEGAFKVTGKVKSESETLTRVDIDYRIPLASGRLEGVIGGGKDMIGSDFRFSANGDNAAEFARMAGLGEMAAEPWSAGAGVSISDAAFYQLSNAQFRTSGLEVVLNGRLGAKQIDQVTDLTFSVKGDRLSDFQSMAGDLATLPEADFAISGKAAAQAESWQLTDIQARAGETRFKVNGILGKRDGFNGSRLAIEANGADLGKMFDVPGDFQLPNGPFHLLTEVSLNNKRIRLDHGRFEAGPFSLALEADVPWPLDLSEGGFSLHTQGKDLTRVLPRFNQMALDPLAYDVQADGEWLDGVITVEQGDIRIGDAMLSLSGRLDLPPNLAATDFQVELGVPDLSRFGTIDGARWAAVPLNLNGRFKGTRHKFLMQEFYALLGQSHATGDFEIDFEPAVPVFDLKLTTDALDLRPLLGDSGESTDQQVEKGARLIPDTAFPMSTLARANGQFSVHADRIRLKKATLINANFNGVVRDGSLSIDELATDGHQGRLQSSLSLQPASDGSARLSATFSAQNFIINLTDQSPEDKNLLPAFNIQANLQSSGNDMREAARKLSGSIRINSPGGEMKNISSDSASALFLAEVISAISPREGKQDVIKVACMAAEIDIKEGIVRLDPGIAVQSDKLNIFAGGRINLDSEKIDINFRTETRKTVDISSSELFSPYVKLGGTLAKPSVALDTKGTLLSGGAAYLSGGLSILAKKALDSITSSKDPCAKFLEEKEG